jgi:hypothetical protein
MTETAAGTERWTDASSFVQRLFEKLDSFDWAGAETICNELITRLNDASVEFPEEHAKQILKMLRKKCQFRLMELVADALIRSGQASPQIRRQYAQSMIDQGSFTSPEFLLNGLASDNSVSPGERAEANGLLGRIYKQLFVDAGGRNTPRQQRNLRKALNYYYQVYQADRSANLWHGINVVALLARARDLGISADLAEDERTLAKNILKVIETKSEAGTANAWDRATSVEANVALDQFNEAMDQLVFFLTGGEADAFETTSLLRQLSEVWQLSPESQTGAGLLTTLRAAQLKQKGGRLNLQREDISKGLETVFGRDKYDPFSWLQLGMQRCMAVARVEDLMGRRVGSGFLLDRKELFDSAGDDPLLLTNYHVISPATKPHPLSVPPDRSVAVFEALNGRRYRVNRILWCSEVEKLDATLVALEKMDPEGSPCPLKPTPAPLAAGRRVYVIGYPLGGPLSISLQDSQWLDGDDRVIHYRTPTDPGSSGSPVFDQEYWTVIGLHHRGKSDMPRLHGQTGTYEANEAISMNAIRSAIRESGTGSPN